MTPDRHIRHRPAIVALTILIAATLAPDSSWAGKNEPSPPAQTRDLSTSSKTTTHVDGPTAYPFVPISCGESGNTTWYTLNTDFTAIRICGLHVKDAGRLLITASGSLMYYDGEYEANFRIGVDDVNGDPGLDRWVNVYNDAGDGNDQVVAVTALLDVDAGWHDVYFSGRIQTGAGYLAVHDPVLTATFIPTGLSELVSCGVSGNLTWTTTGGLETIRQCTLDAPEEGWFLVTADGTGASYGDGEYNAIFSIGVDDPTGTVDYDRWLSIYDDSGDGTDRTVAITAMVPVTPGAHEIYFVGERLSGAGTVKVFDPTLSVVFFPDAEDYPPLCSAGNGYNFISAVTGFVTVFYCDIFISEPGSVLITADSGVEWFDGDYEGQFRVDVDGVSGIDSTDRWVNVYADGDGGTYSSMALSLLRAVPPGSHRVYLLANRAIGAGTLYMHDPTLNVVQVDAAFFFDGFETGDLSHWSSHTP